MGWKGALFEAEQEELVSCHSDDDEQDDEEKFKLLESNGRSAAKYKDGFRTSGGGALLTSFFGLFIPCIQECLTLDMPSERRFIPPRTEFRSSFLIWLVNYSWIH